MEVVPVNFGLKYKPPKLGVEYFVSEQPNMRFVHEIPLSFVNKSTNIDNLVKDLFEKNTKFLNPKVVSPGQVKRLVDKLVKTLFCGQSENKENDQIDNNSMVKGPSLLKPGLNKKPLNDQKQNAGRQLQALDMSPTESEQSARDTQQRNDNNQSISRIESAKDMEGQNVEDLLLSDIQQNQSLSKLGEGGDQVDLDQLLKTGGFSKEMMMGQTMRDLGSTFKEAKGQQNQQVIEDDYAEDFESSQHQHQESINHIVSQEEFSQQQELMSSGFGGVEGGAFDGADISQQQEFDDIQGDSQIQNDDEEDAIDLNNPDDLARRGLQRIQIEGEEDEFLMDQEGNIYDLGGNLVGTADGDGEGGEEDENEDSTTIGNGEDVFQQNQ